MDRRTHVPGGEPTRREALNRGGRLLAGAVAGPAAGAWIGAGSAQARITERGWNALRRALRGRLLRPGDAGFRVAATAENRLYAEVVPRGIALCAGPEDVAACLRWARATGIPFPARSGGHSFAGYSRTTGLQIDLNHFKRVTVDRRSGAVTVAGAVRFAELDTALRPHGVFFPAGQCPPVAVNGFTLGGGFGFYSRTHGLAADTLLRTDVVLAGGERVAADPSWHPDLYWACRGGGGGNFGINTSMTFASFPVGRKVSVCTCVWTGGLESVLNTFQRLFVGVPDTFSLIVRITPAAHGATSVLVLGHHFGPSRELRELLAPALAAAPARSQEFLDLDFFRARDYLADLPGPPQSYVERSRYVDGPMSEAGIASVLEAARRWPGRGSAGARMDFWLWGGAMNAPSPTSTAFVHRRAQSLFAVGANWSPALTRGQTRPFRGWVDDTYAAVGRHATDAAYQNFIDPALRDWKDAYYGENLRRLSRVKRAYDPGNLFRFAESIPG